MKVIFRVDASLPAGTGHVMRCLALAQVLKENNSNVEFICRKFKGNLINKIQASGFFVHELEIPIDQKFENKLNHSHWLGTTQKQDAKDCINILKETRVDWLIVDHYGIDEDWQQDLKDNYDKLMVIDDLADRKHKCDILLDQTFGREQEDYKRIIPKSCQLLLGPQYALLRPEFAELRHFSLERRKDPVFKEILINMGGTDNDNITEKVLQELEDCNLPRDIVITIVMGGSSPHLERVKSRIDNLPFKTEIKIDVDNMAEIMSNADIGIGASGTTTWERCCLGLPTIQIISANNQKDIAKNLKKINAIKLLNNKETLQELLNNIFEWMKSVGDISASICDGLGSKKVMNFIIQPKLR